MSSARQTNRELSIDHVHTVVKSIPLQYLYKHNPYECHTPVLLLSSPTPTHIHTFSQPHLPSTPHHGQVKNASETHHPTLPFFGNSLSLFWLLFLVHLTCTTEIEGRDERCSQSQSQSQSQFFYLSRTCSVLTSIVPWSKRSSHLTQTYNSFVHRNQEPSRNSAGNPNELSLASSGSILVLCRAAHRQTARTAAYDRVEDIVG